MADTGFYAAHIFVCLNERPADHPRGCCLAKGSAELRDYMKKAVKAAGVPSARVNVAGCLERCELGPVMVIYPDDVWYHYTCEADIDEIIQTHLLGGGRVERLMLTRFQKRLTEAQAAAE